MATDRWRYKVRCVSLLVYILHTAVCAGFNSMSYRSSVMDGHRPILRLGPESEEKSDEPVNNIPVESMLLEKLGLESKPEERNDDDKTTTPDDNEIVMIIPDSETQSETYAESLRRSTAAATKWDDVVALALQNIVEDYGSVLVEKIFPYISDGIDAAIEKFKHTDALKDNLTVIHDKGLEEVKDSPSPNYWNYYNDGTNFGVSYFSKAFNISVTDS